MDKSKKENLSKIIDDFTSEFWTIDCLIRIMKEILTNNNWETREEDVYYISLVLAKSSQTLSEKIQELKTKLQ